MSAFDLLHKDIQKSVWDLGWKDFRFIQTESIKSLVNNPHKDIIISAPTSSGKTEAAFLPTLSLSREHIEDSLQILYISPLKALINDQFDRVNDLCRKMDIKVTKWHGDANQTKKKKLLERPSGILLITPESLESLLINREPQARRLFANIKFIIIDEVHAFAGTPRGDQLKSIISRIQDLNDIKCTKIALSATIGSMDNISSWLGSDSPTEIIDKESEKGIRGSIRTYLVSESKNDLVDSLVERSKNGKNLFFANSKRILEELCLETKANSKSSDLIDIHHGSLDKEQRESVEKNLKEKPIFNVFCTNTLELGIDIGDIDEVTLLSPPWSMASFIQKIGRSGRKEDKDISFNFSFPKIIKKNDSHPFELINWPLIKSIALTELLLEGWCEEGAFLTPGYSTLVHQILAYISQKRAITPDDVYNCIVSKNFPEKTSQNEFKEILNSLAEKEIITQEATGEIVLAIKGEKLTENYDFLSVFISPEQWVITNNGSKIGVIPLSNMYQAGDNITLGGRWWKVDSVDYDSKKINVVPSKGGRVPLFEGSGGIVHARIHQKMLEIITSDSEFGYLYPDAKDELVTSRKEYQNLLKDPKFVPIFSGTKVANTLWATIKTVDPEVSNFDFCLLLSKEIPNLNDVFDKFEDLINQSLVNDDDMQKLTIEKFDFLLPPSLRGKSLKAQFFDLKETAMYLKGIGNERKV